ncbi:MAG: histidine phosphatase family protein [Phenylobacterium sp.]|uniref:SixA phosphatase family protein n=1 Tax=Phenylobacterium sp. TaxID=1871053 RepID=UPI001A548D70|nr:histidine phosphatase family protein [Phenylobacterium sp.]MBL8555498.1 histidine phosphatase family protein [Phenylobacterium sp.]
MDRLILFRHGKAEPDSASGDDFDRRLAPRGQEESAEMGAHLAGLGFTPDLALVSPAQRTRDTWASLQGAFPDTEMRIEEHLYHADSGTLRAAAGKAGEGRRTLMIVGHNPGLQELTIQLLREGGAPLGLIGKAQRNFPTAAAAVFLIDANGRPHYDGLFFPGRHH